MDTDVREKLSDRLGEVHARQRIGIENEPPRVFGKGLNFFHPENWYSAHALIRYILKLTGVYWYGRRKALDIQLTENELLISHLPAAFDGLTLLHLSDLHVDMNPEATEALIKRVEKLDYDICVITGDYRAWTMGPIDRAMAGMRSLSMVLKQPVYAVLGNHDSIHMVPHLEDMGIRILLNESVTLEREGETIHLAGIDDAHYYRVDNLEKSAHDIPGDSVSILLSHTPEVYRQAAHTGFDVLLCGHTHGGQICLPGGYPLTLDANCPRYMGSGNWRYHSMMGYTSVGAGTSIVDVRLNCPPEVTLHRLRRTG
jgi:predicted MPP superfamily phosphohydrolase